ncbi:tripartite tricarboxylate transporter TctB family protein [Inquilinus limosus]|uniref:Small permease of tripartite tricarboxylate transporter n=1 Tax=Inquilinus limosus MP06 TaxID=1398085 RepID=A0A0A0D5U8_9PROT|nr:tripartite tricarboxylate transporter TctB family protein [Inquilinus limosus]KGM33223.1 small permease of tripartite tricarboxylate transporter [Inquilinus limosus MP06]
MRLSIRHPKDFWSGLIFLALAIAFGWIAQGYSMGRAIKMGPGYFPTVLAGILALIGLITLVRSFVLEGEGVGQWAWRGGAIVLAAMLLFGLLLRGGGLAVSVPVVVLVGAAASIRFRAPVAATAAVAMTLFCIAVFIWGLGLPIPVFGRWFGN